MIAGKDISGLRAFKAGPPEMSFPGKPNLFDLERQRVDFAGS